MVGQLASILQSLTLQNVLVMCILVVLAIPSYFAWLFMTDAAFRHEFMSSARVIEADVPCLVVNGHVTGLATDLNSVSVGYETRAQMEHLIAIRMPGTMSNVEIKTACEIAHADANMIRAAIRDRDAAATSGK